ncbi:hypothetical protein [Streptomyces sp. CB03911]|uniref:VG15 protein n=1 Tax=Streptomyces sp. CB03911 TaxID=1804758 RepID=UPI00093ABB88|nr:hypothetical protein [Streptomyces sp. CB03911]OKI24424.1 hypothetical protein A6A07_06060 [Streptomyces sp. CB03911]
MTAATELAQALTRAHGATQGGLVSGALRRVLTLWGVLDIENLDDSFAEYLRLAEPVLAEAKHNSAKAAAGYYDMLRAAEGVPGTSQAGRFLADLVTSGEMELSLGPIGPAYIRKALDGGMTFEQAARAAWVKQSGQMSHSILGGSRDTLAHRIERDDRAIGFQRAPFDRNCCAFCGVLASRGAVYKARGAAITAKNGKRYHTHCRCQPQPVFRAGTPLSDAGQRFHKLYADHGDINEVRRHLDGRTTKAETENESGGSADD